MANKRVSRKAFRISYYRENRKRKELEKVLKVIKRKIEIGVVILGDEPFLRISTKDGLKFYEITETEFDTLKEYL